jgi:hypothetical protein
MDKLVHYHYSVRCVSLILWMPLLYVTWYLLCSVLPLLLVGIRNSKKACESMLMRVSSSESWFVR